MRSTTRWVRGNEKFVQKHNDMGTPCEYHSIVNGIYIYKISKSRFFSIVAFQDSQATDICSSKSRATLTQLLPSFWEGHQGWVELEDENATESLLLSRSQSRGFSPSWLFKIHRPLTFAAANQGPHWPILFSRHFRPYLEKSSFHQIASGMRARWNCSTLLSVSGKHWASCRTWLRCSFPSSAKNWNAPTSCM